MIVYCYRQSSEVNLFAGQGLVTPCSGEWIRPPFIPASAVLAYTTADSQCLSNPFPLGDLDPHPIYGSFGTPESAPNGIIDHFSSRTWHRLTMELCVVCSNKPVLPTNTARWHNNTKLNKSRSEIMLLCVVIKLNNDIIELPAECCYWYCFSSFSYYTPPSPLPTAAAATTTTSLLLLLLLRSRHLVPVGSFSSI